MLHTAAWCPEAIPILLANVLFTTAPLPNPPALRAAPFTKGGFWVPSFSKGGTGRISPAVSHGLHTPHRTGARYNLLSLLTPPLHQRLRHPLHQLCPVPGPRLPKLAHGRIPRRPLSL